MGCKARITKVAELVTKTLGDAADPAAGVTVERVYAPEWLDPDFWKDNPNLINSFTGRRIYVFGATERNEIATRGEDFNDYGVVVIVLERYTDQGDPPDSWVDERVAWVESQVYDRLGDPRTDTPPVPDSLSLTCDWTQVYSPELLRKLKVFRSEVTAVIRMIEG